MCVENFIWVTLAISFMGLETKVDNSTGTKKSHLTQKIIHKYKLYLFFLQVA